MSNVGGESMTSHRTASPSLGPEETWASNLEGCTVHPEDLVAVTVVMMIADGRGIYKPV